MSALIDYAKELKGKGELKKREIKLLDKAERVPLSAMQIHWLEKELKARGHKIPKESKKRGKKRSEIKLLKGINKELFPFQKEGVSFIHQKGGKCLIADECGLGKTVQALEYLDLFPELRPAVVVCPGAVKYNWQKEAWRWTQDDVIVLEGRQGEKLTDTEDVIYVINYEILRNQRKKVVLGVDNEGKIVKKETTLHNTGWIDFMLKLNPKAVVVDECQRLSNPDSYQTKDVIRLCRKAKSVIGLSGTPMRNKVADIYTFVNMLEPRLFSSRMNFRKRYCGAKHNGYGWVDTGGTNLAELNKKLTSSIMIRRKKTEVMSQLPTKRRCVVPLEIPKNDPYWKAEKDFIKWYKSTGVSAEQLDRVTKAKALAEMTTLKRLVAEAKLKSCKEWISDFIYGGEKLVCFTWHKSILSGIRDRFKDECVWIDGSCNARRKQEAVEEFQMNDDITLIVGNIKSAGEGVTLTAASNTATLEFDWIPGTHLQAEDRILRIGQDQACTNYYLVAHGTIEEHFVTVLEKKMRMISKAIDGEELGMDLLSEVLKLL
jgi:SNF2 family DNA or RNA helicase